LFEHDVDAAVELLDLAVFHVPEVCARNVELGSVPFDDACGRVKRSGEGTPDRQLDRDEVRGIRSRMAAASSPAPITVIHLLRPSCATASGGGNEPSSLPEADRIMIAASRACSTRPANAFQLRVVFIVRLLSEGWLLS